MTPARLYALAFAWVLAAGALLQLVVLPATPWHAGHGLLAGGDWVGFHALADRLATEIAARGWQAWELRPEGQAPAGIAAALYALTGVHAPWVFLPVNAALYALIVVLLHELALAVTGDRRLALVAVLPALLFPSTATIWGQIHKDVFAIAGTLLVLRFWWRHGQADGDRFGAAGLAALVAGAALMAIVRSYGVELLLLASGCVMLVVLFVHRRTLLQRPRWLAAMLCALVLLAGVERGLQPPVAAPPCAVWKASPVLPVIDRLFAGLACMREGFRLGYPDAGSNIDIDVVFADHADVIAYLPRAAQLALFAPFPAHWSDRAVSPGGAVMRLVSAAEMLLFYAALAGVAALLLRGREAPVAASAALLFTAAMAVIYALVVTNLGTLYRMRFPLLLVGSVVGLASWLVVLRSRRGA